ncbi:MAG: fluoride efflux transporter CrcB [Deltaproteobacteria bacterium]|nr:fluoride efflux transporter CrcB [Deltaproteobacteria bacterium]MBW2421084.1 fluoride efflux transporter CrcB [Deltaproteobacteria bacterium]
MTKLLFIAFGGAAGAVLRYVVAVQGQRLSQSVFPFGTLTVNVLGCLLIGLLGTLFAGPVIVREEYRFALLVGFLGGFTTFSTFGFETLALVSDREWWLASANVLASNVLGLGAVWVGNRLALLWQGV